MSAGIYIHIPFCLRKCFYCDFFSGPPANDTAAASYIKALLREISFYGNRYGKDFKADTVFFGGGTPSLIPPELVTRVIKTLRNNFDISADAEITLECNPATADGDKLAGYRQAGVNRLSVGAQSFDDDVLSCLGRIHKAADIADTVMQARKAGFSNVSLDLMFAVPGLDMKKWRSSLREALALRPEHLSFYSLEIAPGTVFGRMAEEGTLRETPVSADRRMYKRAVEETGKAGYVHYEISNAALPGKECRHNLKYWNFESYMGLGASAHSFIGGVRYANVNDTEGYINAMNREDLSAERRLGTSEVFGAGCVSDYHINTFRDNAAEIAFTALRTRRGLVFSDFYRKTRREFWEIFDKERPAFEEFVRGGYAVSDSYHIALTLKGIDISNKIMALFV